MIQAIIQHCQLLLLAIGLFMRYLIGRRRFNRRSIAGIQGFKNYSYAVLTIAIEKLANVFATVCILLAVLLLIIK